jgi:very-short-patch-repair endonuclease
VGDMSQSRRIRTPEKVQIRAKELRKEMTHAETLLWDRLRNRKLQGLKFRRQQPIGPFIADFYCASHRLVIEIDGNIHNIQEENDELRTQQFEKYGYHIIRFNNREIEDNIDRVLTEIVSQCIKIEHENSLPPTV